MNIFRHLSNKKHLSRHWLWSSVFWRSVSRSSARKLDYLVFGYGVLSRKVGYGAWSREVNYKSRGYIINHAIIKFL